MIRAEGWWRGWGGGPDQTTLPEKPRGQLPGAQGKQSRDEGARVPAGLQERAQGEQGGAVENQQKERHLPYSTHTFIRCRLHTMGEVQAREH